MDDLIGKTLHKRYRLEARLGEGGAGLVYRAQDTLLDRPVAVKMLSTQGLGSMGRARLLAEAQAAARLNHPNIITVYDAGEADAGQLGLASSGGGDFPFIVMELIEGRSLHEARPESLDDTVEIIRQVCVALQHAHEHHIIHRDLKPENVFITPSGTVKLVDFGLAHSRQALHITLEGAIFGTAAYIAPELCLGERASVQSDLYALGVMLYELTAGTLPFQGDDLLAIISQHLHVTPVPPSTHNPRIPAALEALILRLLAKQPGNRPASVREVEERLADILEEGPEAGLLATSPLEQIVRGRMVARDNELSEALARWQLAANGQGGVLLISGEPGIGKTRLARELLSHINLRDCLVFAGECYQEGSLPYAPLARIIEQTFEQRGCLEVEKLSNIILSELISITPALRGTYPDLPPNPPLEPLAEQQRLFDSVARFAAVLAEDRPVCWLVEDVHWADGGTLALLRHLARRVKHLNFLIVLTYREVELSDGRFLNEVLNDLNRERLVERIKLTRFSREETHQLLKAMFAEEISQEFLEGIYRETEGNPFFVEEVCKALIEEGLVYRENGHWQQRRMNEIQVPQSVRVAIEARLDKLPATAQEALRLAATIGREFSYEVLQKACDQPEDVLLEALETAERAQLVNEVKGRPRWVTYSFAHALIPSALRDGMSTLRLQRLHRKVAAAVEALDPDDYEVLAYHFAEGGQEEPAHKYYRLAGDRAFRAGAFQDAEHYYRLALDLATQPEEQAELNGRLSLTLANAGMFKPAIQAARQAIQLAQGLQDDDALGRLYSWLSYTTWQIGDVPGGLAACREGLEVMADYPDSAAKAALLHEAARQCYFNNLPEESGRLALQALAMAEHFGRKDIQVHTLATLALTQPTAQQIATMRQAVELYHTVAPSEANFNLIVGISRTLNNLSEALRDTGRYAEGLDVLRQMLEAARSTGFAEAWAYNAIATILLEQADYAGAERQLAQARALFQADEGQLAVAIQENEALLLFYRGERQAGIGQLEAILDIARQGHDHQAMMISSNDLIKCLIYQEDWERIVSISQEMVAANAIQAVSDAKRASFFYNRAHALAELGDGAGARQAIATADERLAGESHPRLEAGRERAGAHLARAEGRWEDCFSTFERLIQLNAEMGRRWHQAQSMRALAASLRRRGEAAGLPRAVELEVQAQRIFVDIGVKI